VFVSWGRPFDDPIPLPGRRELVTLRDAGGYIAALPKAEQQSPEWQGATEALIMAAEDRGPLMHAHIGMLRALNRRVERAFNPWQSVAFSARENPARSADPHHRSLASFRRPQCGSFRSGLY
jgi:hypothetical protein